MLGWAMLVTAGGCVSLAPTAPSLPLPVPDTWQETIPDSPREALGADTSWEVFFTDIELRALIQAALDNSRDLRTALLRVEEARAAFRIERSATFPSLDVTATSARSRTPADLNLTGRPVVGAEYQAYAGIPSWEVDIWGRVRSLKDAALEEYLASRDAARAARVLIIEQAAQGYLSLCELDERLVLARRSVVSRQESLRIFRRRYEVGAISRFDLMQVEALLTQAQTLGAELERTRALQAHALSELVGAPLDLPLSGGGTLDEGSIAGGLRIGLPSEVLLHRPDVMAAEHRLRSANFDIGVARADFFPRIALTGESGAASADLGRLFSSGSSAWQYGFGATLPLFDAGRRRAALDLAKVRRDEAVTSYDATVQQAFREVLDALSERRWLSEEVAFEKNALRAQTERARLASLRYDRGASPYLEVLDAQRDLLDAQQALVATRRRYLTSGVALYAALGGGAGPFPPDSPTDGATR
jgi:multidrug efflux system outer membrane protein